MNGVLCINYEEFYAPSIPKTTRKDCTSTEIILVEPRRVSVEPRAPSPTSRGSTPKVRQLQKDLTKKYTVGANLGTNSVETVAKKTPNNLMKNHHISISICLNPRFHDSFHSHLHYVT